jgi:rhamnulokinase
MIQAMAAGEGSSVADMRKLIHRSIPLKTYLPKDIDVWDTAFLQFKEATR